MKYSLILVVIGIISGCNIFGKSSKNKETIIFTPPETVYKDESKEISDIKKYYKQKDYNRIYYKLEGYIKANNSNFIGKLIHNNENASYFFTLATIYCDDPNMFKTVFNIAELQENNKSTLNHLNLMKEIASYDWNLFVTVMRCYLKDKQSAICLKYIENEEFFIKKKYRQLL